MAKQSVARRRLTNADKTGTQSGRPEVEVPVFANCRTNSCQELWTVELPRILYLGCERSREIRGISLLPALASFSRLPAFQNTGQARTTLSSVSPVRLDWDLVELVVNPPPAKPSVYPTPTLLAVSILTLKTYLFAFYAWIDLSSASSSRTFCSSLAHIYWGLYFVSGVLLLPFSIIPAFGQFVGNRSSQYICMYVYAHRCLFV